MPARSRSKMSNVRRRGVSVVALLAGATLIGGTATGQPATPKPTDYVASVEVVRVPGAPPPDVVRGTVFEDADRNGSYAGPLADSGSPKGRGRGAQGPPEHAQGPPAHAQGPKRQRSDKQATQQGKERGIPGIAVSNGREVVLTDKDGRYQLPAYDDMTVFVTKPAGFDTPVDEDHIPQFFYHHLPEGSPPLRFGGLPPTGPLPHAINFPLARGANSGEADCAVIGDTQTYSNREAGYLRDGVVRDLAERDDLDECGAFIVGDVAGDDLGLYPRVKQVMSIADIPVRAVPGNHDLDYDATDDENSFDTYLREIGPEYYSYDIGDAHFIGLDNVKYPCTPEEDNADGKHAFCDDPANHPVYNGVIGEKQLAWLANDLAFVPKDKLIVIGTHIPLVSFIDMDATKHQTDDAKELYRLLEGRSALSVSGHAQTLENMIPGDRFAGWQKAVGVDGIPFQHIVVGAASGSWWIGDLDVNGLPESLQRGGAPPGYVNLALDGSTFQDTYRATRRPESEQMSLSISSPFFRDWFDTLDEWKKANPAATRTPPPVNINDLGDPNLLTPADLADGGSSLMANVWNGTTDTEVLVKIDERRPTVATRTQEARGEGIRTGAEFADPYAMMRNLQVARHSLESTSGNERTQGFEAFRGSQFGPGPTQPMPDWLWADQSSSLWRLPLPADLEQGGHTATVYANDSDGQRFVGTLNFEVMVERPPSLFRKEVFPPPPPG